METQTLDVPSKIAELESRIEKLESSRPGRKAKPLLSTEVGVCGLNPECQSEQCTDASVYRYQQGCRGTACVKASSEWYKAYRAKKKAENAEASENGS